MNAFIAGYLASLIAGASWAGTSLLSDTLGATKALKKKIRELLRQPDPAWLERVCDTRSLQEEFQRVAVEVAEDRDAWGISENEEPLFRLLTDEVFQGCLARWLTSRDLKGGTAAKEKLEGVMAEALNAGGATKEEIERYLALYFDLFERHVFANPLLAFRRIEALLVEGPEARRYAEYVAFERAYLKAIREEYGYLELLGLPSYAQRHPIDAAFISLAVSGGDLQQARPAEQVLREHPRLIIQGDAGAGKTTLLQWEAVRCCDGGTETVPGRRELAEKQPGGEEETSAARVIPFFLKLRRLAHRGDRMAAFPLPGDWITYSLDDFTLSAPEGWLHGVIEEGRALLMLDGLDELPPDRRPAFWTGLKRQLAKHPKLHFRITSRFFPREGKKASQWQPPCDPKTNKAVPAVQVQPLTPERIDGLIDQWYQAAVLAEPTQEFRKRTARELKHYAPTLKTKIREPRFRRVLELAETPFLCAAICLINRHRRQILPTARHELYEMLVEALILLRNKERGIVGNRLYEDLDVETLAYLHAQLALDMMTNGLDSEKDNDANGDQERSYWIETDRSDALKWLATYMPAVPALRDKGDAESLLDFLMPGCGLLRQPVKDRLDFRHRALQEYLAGSGAVQYGKIGLLVNHAYDDRWRDTIILAAGGYKVGRQDSIRLIKELITRGRKRRLPIYFAVAVGCLDTARGKVDTQTQDLALSKLQILMPPKNTQDAKVLAAAGDPAAALLPYASFRKEAPEIVAACAETLARIGSDAARAQLRQGYTSDARPVVQLEVLRCPEMNPLGMPGIVGKAHETGSFEVPELAMPYVQDLAPVAGWGAVESLDLRDCAKAVDLGPLSGLASLKTLNLEGCRGITGLAPLRNLMGLRSLDLGDCAGVADLSPLAELTALEELNLSRCPKVTDLTSLGRLTKLRGLRLRCCGGIGDLSPLAQLERLERLDLGYCSGVTDLTPLEGLAGLQVLDLQGHPDAAAWRKRVDSLPAAVPGQDYVETAGGIPILMRWIEGGTFLMGSPEEEEGRYDNEGPVHEVTLPGFWLSATPVTQAQYEAVTGSNPSHFKGGDRPVEEVSWKEATAFCRTLAQQSGQAYALPTEAQWEYACRAGSETRFCFGDAEARLGAYAWYRENAGGKTHPVGQKRANAWNLYDMHGNVYEWCQDWYGEDYYGQRLSSDPGGPSSGSYRVLRGGSWGDGSGNCRSAVRYRGNPAYSGSHFGFRVVCISAPR